MTVLHATPQALHATARWTAAVRAGEQGRSDRLIDDPWAERLAGPEGMAWLADQPPETVVAIAIRARFFDDWLLDVVRGPIRQVVLLGAGLDTRAWRLAWPADTVAFEIDRDDVLQAKQAVMATADASPACVRVAVRADLAGPWPRDLLAAGFDPDRPAAYLAEGVLFYLPRPIVEGVLDGIGELAAPGSRLGFDTPNAAALTSPYTKAWLDMQAAAGAPWVSSMDDPATVLERRGWRSTIVQPGEPAANHGRWLLPVIPAAMTDLPHSWYVTGVLDRSR
jgi:methyltransferase (TIGR00027 family)